MNPRWLALVIVGVAILLIAPIVLLVVAGGRLSGSPAGPSDPSASPSAPSTEGEIAFADAASPEDAAWYRHGRDLQRFPPRLEVGTFAHGVTFEVEWPINGDPAAIIPLRPVLGVGDGVVVMVDDDGRRSTLRAIVAATGEVHDLLASDDVIVDGVLAADGRIAYFITADRLTGALTGAWRVSVAVGAAPEKLQALVLAGPEIRLAAVTRELTRVMLSADGATLGVFRCIDADCTLRTVRTDDGSLVGELHVPRGGGDPFAVTDQWALLRPIVPEGPDRFAEVVDLESGERRPIPFEPWPFGSEAVVNGDEGLVVALQTAGWTLPPETLGQPPGDPPEVTLLGLTDMEVLDTHEPPLSALAILVADDYAVGVDLPPGWLLIWGSEPGDLRMSAWAMSLADGALVPLPDLGELFVQG